jgi:phage terminase large subunit-like protein
VPKAGNEWIRSPADEKAVLEGCYFDLKAAERVRTFFRRFLRHSKGEWAGKPFELLEWQWRDIVAPLFGWKRADGTRRFRRGYIEVPKKNGKSALFSGLSHYLVMADGEPGAEVYSAAVDRDHSQWIREGHIEATPSEAIDYAYIRKRVNELGLIYHIETIAIDRWNATQLAGELEQDGFEMVAFGQGFASMNWPTKKLEKIVLSAKLAHGGNPVLRWMAANVSLETDAADNWKPSKKKSRERIDGIVALIMGLERATTHEAFTGRYFYWNPSDGVTL